MNNSRTIPLNHLGQLSCRGGDALAFLHGQLTAPVAQLQAEDSQFAALCRNDGKTIATVLLWRRENHISLITSQSLLTDVQRHLQKFILRADVVIEAEDSSPPGCWSDPGDLPKTVWPADPQRWISASESDTEHASTTYSGAETDKWIRADIQAGVVWLTTETSGQFLPQELGLDQIGALAFDKGCYPGQEIVARVHFLGKAKKQLVVAECDAELDPGVPVLDSGENQVGMVVAGTADGDAQGACLAQLVVRSSALPSRQLTAKGVPLLVSQSESN